MRKSTKIKVALSILVVIAAFVMPVYYYKIEGGRDLALINKMLKLVPVYVAYIAAIVFRDRNIARLDYSITNNVFVNKRKCRKELIDIIDSYYGKFYLSAAGRLEKLQKECETNEELAVILTLKGMCFLEKGKNELAIKAFSEAVKLDNYNSYAWANFGFANYQLGYHEDARKMFENAVLLDEENAYAHSNLAFFHLYNKEMTDALEHLGKAFANESRNDAIALMALCKGFQGDAAEAKRYCKLYQGTRFNKRLLKKWIREINRKGLGIGDAECLPNWTSVMLGSFRDPF